jgi:choline dehydrogenase-like flavoprotein
MEHPIVRFWGHISGREFLGRGDSHQFYDEFKQRGLGGIILDFRGGSRSDDELIISAIVEMLPSAANRVTLAQGLEDYFGNPGVDLSLHFDEKELETMEEASALIERIYADLGAKDVRKATELRWSHHHMGCCRMGDNPQTSVTDRNLRVHDTSNLYLAGSAVFVTSGASNPTLAITALSHRLGDHLIESLTTDIRQSRDRSLAN